jgi:cytochrome b involved in lipid metabolism
MMATTPESQHQWRRRLGTLARHAATATAVSSAATEQQHVHIHLPDSIKDMSPEQLAALMGRLVGGTGQEQEQPMDPRGGGHEDEDTSGVDMHATKSTARMSAQQLGALSGADAGSGARRARAPTTYYSMEEVAARKGQGWVVLHGRVYNFGPFLDQHPGGRRAILRLAGGDATKVFSECHTPAIYQELAPRYMVGTLVPGVAGVLASSTLEEEEKLVPEEREAQLAHFSPFPSERFDRTGLEAFRFQWASLDWLLRRDTGSSSPSSTRRGLASRPVTAAELSHVHRAKSHISPLNYSRDWLHVSDPQSYVADMTLKHRLLTGERSRPLCYVTSPESREGEQAVLSDVIAWAVARHPGRFSAVTAAARRHHSSSSSSGNHSSSRVLNPDAFVSVSTLTPGYEHTFELADFAAEPLRLAGLLVQEDFYLMVEDEIETSRETVTPSGMEFHLPDIPGYDKQQHAEDHPSGCHHIFTASSSCFSERACSLVHRLPLRDSHAMLRVDGARSRCCHHRTQGFLLAGIDAVDKHMRPMSSIHAPYVPGWDYQLQKHMNRLFTNMTTEQPLWRHNFNFTARGQHTASLLHDNAWAPLALPELAPCGERSVLSLRDRDGPADWAHPYLSESGELGELGELF